MNIDCKLVEKMSAKTGKPYLVLVIKISENYEKFVFLDKAEVELLKIQNK